MRNNDSAFGNSHTVPIIGAGKVPILTTQMALTPELLAKLQEWMHRTGFPVQELGNMIYRLGLMALSFNIDADNKLSHEDVHKIIPKTSHSPDQLGSLEN